MLLEELRKEIVFYGQEMLKSGLTMHTGGNLSARDPKTGLIVIKPTSLPYRTMRPEDVPVIDENGKMIDGSLKPSSEWPMHTMIYQAMPRVMGIVHDHSIHATACSVADIEIPLIMHEICIYCSSPVKVAAFEVPGTPELGQSALKYLGDNDIVLLGQHGPLAVGATLWHAFDAACAVEQAASMLLVARQLGGTVSPVPSTGRKALRSADPLLGPDGQPPEIKAV